MIWILLVISYLIAGVVLGYIGKKKTRGPAKTFGDYAIFVVVWLGLTAFFYAILGGV